MYSDFGPYEISSHIPPVPLVGEQIEIQNLLSSRKLRIILELDNLVSRVVRYPAIGRGSH